MNRFSVIFFIATASATAMSIAKPPHDALIDGFGPAAESWLKKHPDVKKCANQKVDEFRKEESRTKNPDDIIVRSDMYGEFIDMCDKKLSSKAKSPQKMRGDVIDNNPNAKPRSASEAKNKKNGKDWQDENGFIHFSDGSVTNGPID